MIGKNIGTLKFYQTTDLIPNEGNWNHAKTKNIQFAKPLYCVFKLLCIYAPYINCKPHPGRE